MILISQKEDLLIKFWCPWYELYISIFKTGKPIPMWECYSSDQNHIDWISFILELNRSMTLRMIFTRSKSYRLAILYPWIEPIYTSKNAIHQINQIISLELIPFDIRLKLFDLVDLVNNIFTRGRRGFRNILKISFII